MQRADVVVIGGGVVGCACTYFLSRAGLKVTLLERGGITSGTSGACMGHLMVMPSPPLLYELTHRSVLLWKDFAREFSDLEMRHTGVLWLGESEEDLPLLEGLHRSIREHEDSGELLDPGELRQLEPALAEDLVGAFYYPEDAVLSPMQACGVLLRAAQSAEGGAVICPSTAVKGLRLGPGNRVAGVKTEGGEIEAGAVVNAAGVWAPEIHELAGLGRAPIFPRRGDLAITLPRSSPVRHQLLEVAYLRTAAGQAIDPESEQVDPGAIAMNLQPQCHGSLLIGSTRQFGGYDRSVNQALLEQSLRRAIRFVPGVAGLQILRSWAGLRPYTKDKLPILGPVPGLEGYYMASGHEGLGISLSTVTGELIAQAVTGQTPSISLDELGIARFAVAGDTVPNE